MRAALFTLVVFITACARSSTIGTQEDAQQRQDTMTLTGRVCTDAPDPNRFPTRVFVILDQSGSMCVTDPPSSQQNMGLCEQIPSPAGVTEPARVAALKRMIRSLEQVPNVSVTLIPFDTVVRGVTTARPGDAALWLQVNNLQSSLGNASDLQGALQTAHDLIEADVNALELSNPGLLPRSRYVVMVLTDGAPYPRCSANDSLTTFADDTHPSLVWPDNDSYCNTAVPQQNMDGIPGFIGGQDRNQNAQLFDLVDRMLALRNTRLVGDVRVNTVMMFNEENVAWCGPLCQDLFGQQLRWPGPTAVPAGENGVFARTAGAFLMREIANRGGGSYSEFLNRAGVAMVSLTNADLSSLAALNVIKRFTVQPLKAIQFEGAWVPDSDGDAVPDAIEVDAGTNAFLADSDGDGFDDLFEQRYRDAGFEALVKDARGCDPASALTPGCLVRDTDGDGFSQYAEAYLGTSPTLEDTDRDGFADGLELRFGLDPLVFLNAATDSDGDGLTDAQEVSLGSNPKRADRSFADALGITTVLDEQMQADGSACYTFTASNLPLVAPPGEDEQHRGGYNLFKVWFAGAPQSAPRDVGDWRAACAWARKDGTTREPASLSLEVPFTAFVPPNQLIGDPSLATNCMGVAP